MVEEQCNELCIVVGLTNLLMACVDQKQLALVISFPSSIS